MQGEANENSLILNCDSEILRVTGCCFFMGFRKNLAAPCETGILIERPRPLQRYEPPLELIICPCILYGTL